MKNKLSIDEVLSRIEELNPGAREMCRLSRALFAVDLPETNKLSEGFRIIQRIEEENARQYLASLERDLRA